MSIDTPSTDAEAESSSSTPRTGSTTFINTSGGLLTDELVSKLRQRHCGESAVRPETFALPDTEPPEEADIEAEIGDTWDTLRERWDELTMDETLFHMDVSGARTKWILKLFQNLGFEPVFQRENLEAGGIEANLSHKGWPDGDIESYGEMEGRTAPIIHTVEPEQKLDEKPEDAPRGAKSPHDTLQEFLNASNEHDWAVVTNGLTLRVLRDFYHTYTRGYVEFDLENLFTNRNYGDFRALYRLCHATRFIEPVVADEEDDIETPLEQLYQVALSTGVKVGQDLQDNVVNALETLGNGFLNSEIEAALEDGGQDAAENYYQDLLYVVYRLLFLMFAEQRGMMSQRDSLFTDEYSITKLRERAEQREKGDRNTDLWEGLKATFQLVGEGHKRLGVPGYNGDLFDNDNLEYILDAECPNEKLLSAVDDLTHIEQEGYRQRISYADLGVEEIGAVYESLLEFTPQIAETAIELEERTISPDSFYLDGRGMERKETGSYYTDPELVDELIQSSLKPVVEDKVDENASTEVQEQQLLDITVCDPACGSGAFLIAANNFLAQRLAEIRSDSLYPDERTIRQARRSVVQHCLYGVDLNPMAVELAKVSLWINSAVEDKPLSFLDHRIKQGNSLIGTTPELISQGVPVDAYETSKGRDWHKGNEIRKRVRQENKELDDKQRQVRLDRQWGKGGDDYVSLAEQLDQLEEKEIQDVYEKEKIYRDLRESDEFQQEKLTYDVWTAAFYWPIDGSADEYPTPNTIERIRRNPPEASNAPLEELTGLQHLRERASRLSSEENFFHWPLEFPAIYADGGFDCLLGNPPWERLEVIEEEFFAVREPYIANARNSSERKERIKELQGSDADLYNEYQKEKKRTEQRTSFLHSSGRYPLTGRGNLNTYALFSELALTEIDSFGFAGIIVPTGIATNSRTQYYFGHLVENSQLKSLFDFGNEQGIFPDVDGRFHFSLLTISGNERSQGEFELAFDLKTVDELKDDERKFTLTSEEIQLINPNTNNLPTFEDAADADLVTKIYRGVGAFVIEDQKNGNPWNVESGGEFHMSHDSEIFETKQSLENSGWVLDDNIFKKDEKRYLPLYESKLFHQYNHRFATFEDVSEQDIKNGNAKRVSEEELDQPDEFVIPRYWVPEDEYQKKHTGDWHIGLRTISRATDERTSISTILPEVGAADSLSVLKGPSPTESLTLVSLLNSFALDYVLRQKLSGSNLNYYMIWQLPVPDPEKLAKVEMNGTPVKDRINELALELSYTANDLEPLAKDLGIPLEPNSFSGDSKSRDELRFEIEALLCHVYGLDEEDLDHLFTSFKQIKQNDVEEYGYYRTREEIKSRFVDINDKIVDTNGEI